MKKRNKQSEEKKYWIMEAWKNRHKKPVLSDGIFLTDRFYPVTEGSMFQGLAIRDADGNIVNNVGPVEIWGGPKKGYIRYNSTIEARKKSWPMYTIEKGKFVDYQWPKKLKSKVNRVRNR